MLEIYLTRHGETQWNTIRRMQGQNNSPLTELGTRQAKWLARRLKGKKFSYVYTSPLGRAKETAVILNDVLGAKLVEDDRLMEIALGDWEGRLVSEVEQTFPKEHEQFWHNPLEFGMDDKEDFFQVRERAADFFESLIKQHGEGKILVVAHAIILKGMMNYIRGNGVGEFWTGRHILPTSLSKINVQDHRYSIIYEGEVSHHQEEMAAGWFIDEE